MIANIGTSTLRVPAKVDNSGRIGQRHRFERGCCAI